MAKEEEKPKQDSEVAAVPARRYVDVECIDIDGYVKGAHTTLPLVRAEELVKAKKAKLIGEAVEKTNKKAPAANSK